MRPIIATVQVKASGRPRAGATPGSLVASAEVGSSSGPISIALGTADSNAATSGDFGDCVPGPTTSTVLSCWPWSASSSYGSQKMSPGPPAAWSPPLLDALARLGGDAAAC